MVYLVRYSEIGLKSEPVRRRFLSLLRDRIEETLSSRGIDHVIEHERGRIYVFTEDEAASQVLQMVPGIHSFSPAVGCSSEMDDILSELRVLGSKVLRRKMSFGMRVKRTGEHPYSSRDITMQGADSVTSHLKVGEVSVDLDDPDIWVEVEIRGKRAFIFTERLRGLGGMPSGSQGRAILYLPCPGELRGFEWEEVVSRSLISWMMMERRGVRIIPCLHSECAEGWREMGWRIGTFVTDFRPFILSEGSGEGPIVDAVKRLKVKAVVYPLNPIDDPEVPLLHDAGLPVASLFPTAGLIREELPRWEERFLISGGR